MLPEGVMEQSEGFCFFAPPVRLREYIAQIVSCWLETQTNRTGQRVIQILAHQFDWGSIKINQAAGR